MEFTFETAYDQKALTAMARSLRKSVRKKKSRRSHIFGWIVVIIALFLSLPFGDEEFTIGFNEFFTWLAALMIAVVTIWEDAINGYVAGKRLLPGTEKSTVTFRDDGYYSVTNAGNSEFKYANIQMLAETTEYFVFIFSASHAQLYSKDGLSGGTADQFRKFIEEKTGKTIQSV